MRITNSPRECLTRPCCIGVPGLFPMKLEIFSIHFVFNEILLIIASINFNFCWDSNPVKANEKDFKFAQFLKFSGFSSSMFIVF